METTYAILDANGVMINAIIAIKDDVDTLNKVLEAHNASSYIEIDPEIYNVRVGFLRWNGTGWEKIAQN